MPELREVFEMVRNKTQPVPDSWEEQQKRQRRVAHNRRIGAISLASASRSPCNSLFASIVSSGSSKAVAPDEE